MRGRTLRCVVGARQVPLADPGGFLARSVSRRTAQGTVRTTFHLHEAPGAFVWGVERVAQGMWSRRMGC
jgi:hypothetical protein